MNKNLFLSLLSDDGAQGLVEYALIVALVSVAAIVSLGFLGHKTSNVLSNAANSFGPAN